MFFFPRLRFRSLKRDCRRGLVPTPRLAPRAHNRLASARDPFVSASLTMETRDTNAAHADAFATILRNPDLSMREGCANTVALPCEVITKPSTSHLYPH